MTTARPPQRKITPLPHVIRPSARSNDKPTFYCEGKLAAYPQLDGDTGSWTNLALAAAHEDGHGMNIGLVYAGPAPDPEDHRRLVVSSLVSYVTGWVIEDPEASADAQAVANEMTARDRILSFGRALARLSNGLWVSGVPAQRMSPGGIILP